MHEAIGKRHTVERLILDDFPCAFGSRFWLPEFVLEVLLAVTLETVRYAFHQITSSFQTLGRGARAERRRIRREVLGRRLELCNSELRE
jgi:hypothetical protein